MSVPDVLLGVDAEALESADDGVSTSVKYSEFERPLKSHTY